MTFSQILAKRILQLADERHWSINQVAILAKLPQSTVNNIVSNIYGNPTLITVASIAKAFDMSLANFLDMPEISNLTLDDLQKMKTRKK